MSKKLRKSLAVLLSLLLILSMIPMAALAEDDEPITEEQTPSVSVTMEDLTGGIYKLVFSATAEKGISTVETWLAYDNTVIQPVHRTGYTDVTIEPAVTNGTLDPLNRLIKNSEGDNYSNEKGWYISGSKTTFYLTMYDTGTPAANYDAEYMEFYFRLKDGKSTADMNSTTFTIENQSNEAGNNMALTIKTGSGKSFYYYNGGTGDTDFIPTLTYTNSNVVPAGPEEYPAGTQTLTSGGLNLANANISTQANAGHYAQYGIYWNEATNTLILSGAKINTPNQGEGNNSALNLPAGSTILLKGTDNEINYTNSGSYPRALRCAGDLEIRSYSGTENGALKLTVTNGGHALEAGAVTVERSTLTFAGGDFWASGINSDIYSLYKIENAPLRLVNGEPKEPGTYRNLGTGFVQSGDTIDAVVKLYNYDDTLLYANAYAQGTANVGADYTGKPKRPADNDHIYTFAGWDDVKDGTPNAVEIAALTIPAKSAEIGLIELYAQYTTAANDGVALYDGALYGSVQLAVDAAVAAITAGSVTSAEVTMTADSTEPMVVIPEDTVITLDIGSFTLQGQEHQTMGGGYSFNTSAAIYNLGKLTITGTSEGEIIGPQGVVGVDVYEYTHSAGVHNAWGNVAGNSDAYKGELTIENVTIRGGAFGEVIGEGGRISVGVKNTGAIIHSITNATLTAQPDGEYCFGASALLADATSGGYVGRLINSRFEGHTAGIELYLTEVQEISGCTATSTNYGMNAYTGAVIRKIENSSFKNEVQTASGIRLFDATVNELINVDVEGLVALLVDGYQESDYKGTKIGKISGGTFAGGNNAISLQNGSSVEEIADGTFTGKWVLGVYSGSNVGTISGGTFTGVNYGLDVENGSRIESITGGEFTGYYGGIGMWSAGEIGEISGGTFTGTELGIGMWGGSDIGTISGGTFNSTQYAAIQLSGASKITEITDGTLTSVDNNAIYMEGSSSIGTITGHDTKIKGKSGMNVNGSTITNIGTAEGGPAITATGGNAITIQDGSSVSTIQNAVISATTYGISLTASGSSLKKITGGSITTTGIRGISFAVGCTVDEISNLTIDASANTSGVGIYSSCDATYPLTIRNIENVTITAGSHALQAANFSTVERIADCTFTGSNGMQVNGLTAGPAKVTIESGTFEGNVSGDYTGYAVYTGSNGQTTINGGKFKGTREGSEGVFYGAPTIAPGARLSAAPDGEGYYSVYAKLTISAVPSVIGAGIGGEFTVPVKVHGGAFAAAQATLDYDNSILEYVGEKTTGLGSLNVYEYTPGKLTLGVVGESGIDGTTIATLTFRVKTVGKAVFSLSNVAAALSEDLLDFPADIGDSGSVMITRAITKGDFTVNEDDVPYSGSAVTKNITTNLVKTQDYTVVYSGDTTNAGTVTITIKGAGYYTGEVKYSFEITRIELTSAMLNTLEPKYAYTGSPITPPITVTWNEDPLTVGSQYTLEYAANTNVGQAEVTVTGIGNFSGTVKLNFQISSDCLYGEISFIDNYAAAYNGKKILLLLADAEPGAENAYIYSGTPMFYASEYNGGTKYAFICFVDAATKIQDANLSLTKGSDTYESIGFNGDVNQNNFVNIVDAQVVYDFINSAYKNNSNVGDRIRFEADVNGDKAVSVADVMNVVAKILNPSGN